MLFAESNIGDKGANEKQNTILKMIEGERNHTNNKVNFDNPVAKQRSSKFLIIDVSKLNLNDYDIDKEEISLAVAGYYESNFWI
jgi:hypothetical protein